MVALIPAPELRQGADEDLIVEMGAIIFPNFVQRVPGTNGLRLRIDGDYMDVSLRRIAADRFQILLGVLRAWRPLAGQRDDEVQPGIGSGAIRDEHGNQVVTVGPAIFYALSESEVRAYAGPAKLASERSSHLRNALWLYGRRDRNAADCYMIYEYAERDLGGSRVIIAALGVSANEIKNLRSSTNNLAPIDGGRHATGSGTTAWSLDTQLKFAGRFLRAWIAHRAA